LRVVSAWLEVACSWFKVVFLDIVFVCFVWDFSLNFFVMVDFVVGIGFVFEGLELGGLVMGIVLFDFGSLG